MKRPGVKITPQQYAGRQRFDSRGNAKPPTYDQAIEVLERAEILLDKRRRARKKQPAVALRPVVYWEYRRPELRGYWMSFHRCECGDIAFQDRACNACCLIASCLVESNTSGSFDVRYQRAERTLNRIAEVVATMKRQAYDPIPMPADTSTCQIQSGAASTGS